MPMDIRDPEDKTPSTKDVTPEGLHSEGPHREYFTILDYTDDKVVREARAAATTTSQLPGKLATQEVDNDLFTAHLVKAQLRDWRSIVPPGKPFNHKTMFKEDDNFFWKFMPENVEHMPRGARLWLASEILDCHGVIPTEKLKVTSPNGKIAFDFRRQTGGVDSEQESVGSAEERNTGVPKGSARHRITGGG